MDKPGGLTTKENLLWQIGQLIKQLNGGNNMRLSGTITPSGTTGAQTIDKVTGTVNVAAGQSSVVVTNSLVTTDSLVIATIRTNDATARITNVVPGNGSFTIRLVSPTAEVSIGFLVINQ